MLSISGNDPRITGHDRAVIRSAVDLVGYRLVKVSRVDLKSCRLGEAEGRAGARYLYRRAQLVFRSGYRLAMHAPQSPRCAEQRTASLAPGLAPRLSLSRDPGLSDGSNLYDGSKGHGRLRMRGIR
jgi:hypothetical protein